MDMDMNTDMDMNMDMDTDMDTVHTYYILRTKDTRANIGVAILEIIQIINMD